MENTVLKQYLCPLIPYLEKHYERFYILGILIRLLKAQKQIIRHVNSH